MNAKGKKIKRVLLESLLGVVLLALVALGIFMSKNTRGRLFVSSVHVMTHTLKDKSYLLYDIDIMEFCREYLNSDVSVTGNVGVNKTARSKSSIFLDTQAERSFAQKKMATKSTLSLLAFEVGELDLYAQDETVYLEVPFLSRDFGYAFPTGINLFAKAPDLTHDIDVEWFKDNLMNIGELTAQVGIEELGAKTFDGDKRACDGFRVTIPEGCGDFIWELLGMDGPDYDVVVDMYLTKSNYIRRIEMDLSQAIEGVSLVIDGTSISSAFIRWNLPDDETFEMSMVRSGEYKDYFDITGAYFTNIDKVYEFSANMTFSRLETGFDVKVHDIRAWEGKSELLDAYFIGTVRTVSHRPDLFDGGQSRLDRLEVLDWKAVRNDAQGFIDDVMEKVDIVSILGGE